MRYIIQRERAYTCHKKRGHASFCLCVCRQTRNDRVEIRSIGRIWHSPNRMAEKKTENVRV